MDGCRRSQQGVKKKCQNRGFIPWLADGDPGHLAGKGETDDSEHFPGRDEMYPGHLLLQWPVDWVVVGEDRYPYQSHWAVRNKELQQ